MSTSSPILEGVLAIHKPSAISSAQVIRDVQRHFNPSRLFAPWLQNEHDRRDRESQNQKRKRRWKGRGQNDIKMGHGGTLDPMATGVLILGIGKGTKQLHHFSTECTKTYEAVLLFGVATDSYDTEGKILDRKSYDHITRETVEEKLAMFRGKGMQKPPIFSAIRVQGKRLYEYAREGKEVPVEIQERPVEVHELEMLEWMPGGSHEWHWPDREAEKDEKQFAEKVLHLADQKADSKGVDVSSVDTDGKRKREEEPPVNQVTNGSTSKRTKVDEASVLGSSDQIIPSPEDNDTPHLAKSVENATPAIDEASGAQSTTVDVDAQSSSQKPKPPCPAPACRIRMSVTSGFYVRSLCHDLGAAVGSLGIMADLVRTKQGDFELGTNVLCYDELKQGEDVWGPKVRQMLEEWTAKHEDS